jgi:hypothetical protein
LTFFASVRVAFVFWSKCEGFWSASQEHFRNPNPVSAITTGEQCFYSPQDQQRFKPSRIVFTKFIPTSKSWSTVIDTTGKLLEQADRHVAILE